MDPGLLVTTPESSIYSAGITLQNSGTTLAENIPKSLAFALRFGTVVVFYFLATSMIFGCPWGSFFGTQSCPASLSRTGFLVRIRPLACPESKLLRTRRNMEKLIYGNLA